MIRINYKSEILNSKSETNPKIKISNYKSSTIARFYTGQNQQKYSIFSHFCSFFNEKWSILRKNKRFLTKITEISVIFVILQSIGKISALWNF